MQLDFRTATRFTALVLLSVGLGACKGTDVATETPAEECTTGHQRACYGGPEETAGVGKCRRGVQECIGGKWSPLCKDEILPVAESCDGADNDCDGSIDEGKDNGCGGCAQLPGSPGSACTGCGTWTCDGVDRLTCVPPQNTVGDDCQRDGCPGKYVCGAGGVSCDAPAKNACGTCGGPAVGGIGESCTATGGCPGKLACNASGTATECRATANGNECGVCNGPPVFDLGAVCMNAQGCLGRLVCNAAGDGSVCDAPSTCTTAPAVVKLSELSPGGPSLGNTTWNTDEFVELYNPTNTTQNLTNHALWYRGGGTTFRKMLNFPAGTVIAPKGYLLLGKSGGPNSTGYVGPPTADLLYAASADMGGTGGQVYLTSNTSIEPASATDPHVVDMVGYGVSTVFEGAAAAPAPPSVPAGSTSAGSIERKAFVTSTTATMEGGADALKGNGYDSGDNGADFVTRTVREPQSSSSPAEQ